MKKPKPHKNWFFVDESGDTTFYGRKGKLRLGTPGTAPYFILGFIESTNPRVLRQEISALHQRIIADPYLDEREITSMVGTKQSFHATDDCWEVRYEMYKLLSQLDFKAQFVVVRKSEQLFQNHFNARSDDMYEYLISMLLRSVLHRYEDNHIVFSERGSSTRQHRLSSAIEYAIDDFQRRTRFEGSCKVTYMAQQPHHDPCLAIVDYMNWAVYQWFTKGAVRFYRAVEDRVSFLTYFDDNGPVSYSRKKRLCEEDVERIRTQSHAFEARPA